MNRCHNYHKNFLDHLYGLLEPAQVRELEAHVEECASCQAALEKARGHKKSLAKAAVRDCAFVTFEKPAPEAYPSRKPAASVPMYRPMWRWAVAASVLVVLSALSIPSVLLSQQRERLAEARAHLERVDQEAKQVEEEYKRKADRARDAFEKASQAVAAMREKDRNDRDVMTKALGELSITGPRSPQAGAQNIYNVQLKQNEATENSIVDCQILNKDQKEIGRPRVVKGKNSGEYQLVLDPTLPVKPDSDLTLVVRAQTKDGKKMELREIVKLVAPVYLTHLATDKPMYQPGETLRFRSLTLERFSLRPAQEDLVLTYTLTKPTKESEVILQAAGPIRHNNNVVLGPDGQPLRGLGCGEYQIAADAPGGEYILTVSDEGQRFPAQERKFIVNRYEKPRMDKELEFTRKSYGPGDTVTVQCKATPAGGGLPIAHKPVSGKLTVEGKTIDSTQQNLKTDAKGCVAVSFKLPDAIDRADATVTIRFTDGANHEPLSRPVPLVLKKLNVEFFAEGGDLVLGVPNRVYFQARNTLGKPAELRGRIIDQNRNVVADAETFSDPNHPGANHGMGVFAFTPVAGKQYELLIDSPVGIEGKYLLPEVQRGGVVLTIPQGVTDDKEIIRATVRSAEKDRDLLVGAYCRGRLMASQRIAARKGRAHEIELTPETGVGGVYRVTVFEETDEGPRHIAERLVYRAPAELLKFDLKADKTKYVPGDRASITCKTQDERGQAIPAVVMVAVVDQSVVKMADEKTYRSMPTHFLLTTEVRKPEDLEHTDFLLTKDPKAYTALDLLLGTQGWRRFAEQEPANFRKNHAEEADRILAATTAAQNQELERFAQVVPSQEFQAACSTLDQARLERDKALGNAELLTSFDHLDVKRQQLESEIQATAASVAGIETSVRRWLVPTLWLVAGILALVLVFRRLGAPQIIPFAVTAACSLALFAVVFKGPGEDRTMALAKADERNLKYIPYSAGPKIRREAVAPPHAEEDIDKDNRARPAEPADPKAQVFDAPGGKAKLDDARKDFKNLGLEHGKGEGKAEGGGGGKEKAELLQRARDIQLWNLNKAMPASAAAPKPSAPNAPGRDGTRRIEKMKKQAEDRYEPLPEFERNALYRGQREVKDAERLKEVHQIENLFVVREYAHSHIAGKGNVRSDFTETVYWHPALVTANGSLDLGFDLSDSVTTYQIVAAGHTLDGRIGAAISTIESRLPIHIEPKMPIEINANDKMSIPVTVTNNSDERRTVTIRARFEGLKLEDGKTSEQVVVDPGQRVRRLFKFQPTIVDGYASLQFDAISGTFAGDAVARKLKVVPEGFPFVGSKSDLLESSASETIVIPEGRIPNTLKCAVTVYPSTLADLQKGLDALLREPHGCFEQTSTTNYPNILILDYLKETDQAKPEVVRRAKDLLNKGYAKLTSFECSDRAKSKKQGYEWFGGTAPPHEALTAYGLLQFRDMARVYDVDKTMLDRTKDYLLSCRDGKGGFKRNPRALDSFGRAPEHITNAYIVWALTEAGITEDLTKELDAIAAKAKTSDDPYFLALAGNALLNRSRRDEATLLLQKIIEKQDKSGQLVGKETSITGSRGRDLEIETTALTIYAWLKAQQPNLFQKPISEAIGWLGKQRGGRGGFGSTQATILALKAIIAHAKAQKKASESGELVLYVNDREVNRLAFAAGADEAMSLDVPEPEKNLKPGSNKIRVEVTGKNNFPYTLAWSYNTLTPNSAAKCPVHLATALDRTSVAEGDTVRLNVSIENKSGEGQGMAVAIIGLPAGLTIPEDMKQLKDLIRVPEDGSKPVVSAFETRERELILYWRDLAVDQKIDLSVDLICRIPGECRGTASRAYLYYNADLKHWIDPLKVAIAAK